MLDSCHAGTPANLQLGEGVLLRNIPLDAVLLAADPSEKLEEIMAEEDCLLGAVPEGCVFRCVPEMIDLTRGKRTPAAGELLQGRWTVTLSGTLLELTPGNAAMLLNTGHYTQVQGRASLVPEPEEEPAPLDNVCWIGSTGSGMAAIELHRPVSTGGMAFRAGRRGTGRTAFTLAAQAFTPGASALPCRFLWLKGGGAP